MKKMREQGIIAQNKGKFRLEISYKHKLLKALEQGKTGVAKVNKNGATINKKKKAAKGAAATKKGGKSGQGKKDAKKAMKKRNSGAVAKRGAAAK